MNEPIDAVITWVDGSDIAHINKRKQYLLQAGNNSNIPGAHPTRFNQCGEINFCIHSIFKYAPWIRNIYIVTDNQIPRIGNTFPLLHDKIKIIDHTEIFKGYEKYLPTFNSLAIESMLWRIEGLSEKFIYFNDDCFLMRPIQKNDFFCEDKLILRGNFKVQTSKKMRNFLPESLLKLAGMNNIQQHRKVQENSALKAGFNRIYFHLPHVPFGNYKSIYENFFVKHEDLLINNIKYHFRDDAQFWPVSLSAHILIKNFDVVFDNTLKALNINGSFHNRNKVEKLIRQVQKNSKTVFLCLQSLDITPDNTRKRLLKWLGEWI